MLIDPTLNEFTLEIGRGETYASGRPTLYGHGRYPRSSVLAGQSRRVWIEDWDDLETAKAALASENIEYLDLTEIGSTHVPVSQMVSHLPDGEH